MDVQTILSNTRARLRRHEGRYAEISRASPGFSYSWLSKLANGKMANPTVTSLQQLIEALDAFEGVLPSTVGKRIDSPEAVAQAFAVPPADPAPVEAAAHADDPDATRVEPFEEVP